MQYLLQIRSHGGLRLFRGKVIEEKRVASHWRLFFIRSRAADECISSPLCSCVVVWVYFFFSFSRCCFFLLLKLFYMLQCTSSIPVKSRPRVQIYLYPIFPGWLCVCAHFAHTGPISVCVYASVHVCLCVCTRLQHRVLTDNAQPNRSKAQL